MYSGSVDRLFSFFIPADLLIYLSFADLLIYLSFEKVSFFELVSSNKLAPFINEKTLGDHSSKS